MSDAAAEAHAGPGLAARWRRLVAVLVDFALVPAVALVLMLVTGVLEHAEAWAEWWRPIARAAGLVLAAYLLLNGWLLARRGQTVGKWLLRVRIAAAGVDAPPAFWKLLVRAFGLAVLAFGMGLLAGGATLAFGATCAIFLADALCIMGAKRRCLHDTLLGTEVVNAAAQRG